MIDVNFNKEDFYDMLSDKGKRKVIEDMLYAEESQEYYEEEEREHAGPGAFLIALGIIIALGLAI